MTSLDEVNRCGVTARARMAYQRMQIAEALFLRPHP